ncbi:MAG: hypothetical protein ABIH39_00770 [Candidatus Margulisiibacteriota bacterium]
MVYMTGKQKASVLLSLIGKDTASVILQGLPVEMAEYLTAGFTGPPTPEQISLVLNELRALPPGSSVNQDSKAGQPKPVPPKETINKIEDVINYYPNQFIDLLKNERKQMIKFMISHFPEEVQLELASKLVPHEKLKISPSIPIMDRIYVKCSEHIINKVRQL